MFFKVEDYVWNSVHIRKILQTESGYGKPVVRAELDDGSYRDLYTGDRAKYVFNELVEKLNCVILEEG